MSLLKIRFLNYVRQSKPFDQTPFFSNTAKITTYII